MNIAAIERGAMLKKLKFLKNGQNLKLKAKEDTRNIPDFIKNVVEPMNRLKGDDLKVSAFKAAKMEHSLPEPLNMKNVVLQ